MGTWGRGGAQQGKETMTDDLDSRTDAQLNELFAEATQKPVGYDWCGNMNYLLPFLERAKHGMSITGTYKNFHVCIANKQGQFATATGEDLPRTCVIAIIRGFRAEGR